MLSLKSTRVSPERVSNPPLSQSQIHPSLSPIKDITYSRVSPITYHRGRFDVVDNDRTRQPGGLEESDVKTKKRKPKSRRLVKRCVECFEKLPEVRRFAAKQGIDVRWSFMNSPHHTKIIHVVFDRDGDRIAQYWPSNGTLVMTGWPKLKVATIEDVLELLDVQATSVLTGSFPTDLGDAIKEKRYDFG